ncbi:Secreted protein [Mycobacterium basiliense]
MRVRKVRATTTPTAMAMMAIAVCAAVNGVTGANIRSPPLRPSHLPIAANPDDSDSYCGSNDSPSTRGTNTKVSPS